MRSVRMFSLYTLLVKEDCVEETNALIILSLELSIVFILFYDTTTRLIEQPEVEIFVLL
jgi:hypothetical protein